MTENKETESEFDTAVDPLTEFIDYFSSKEMSNQLVEWIHDDLGINKSIARALVKKLAPWVLARARKAGQKVGLSGWTNFTRNSVISLSHIECSPLISQRFFSPKSKKIDPVNRSL